MRLFVATLATETNTFATLPTGIADFKRNMWVEGDIHSVPGSPQATPGQIWVDRGRKRAWDVVQSLFTCAPPGGITVRRDYEAMRDRILSDLKAACPVDAIIMFLHGAMIAEGYPDCEGDLLSRMREIAGAKARIAVELDLHAHLDETIIKATDIIVLYKTYPHIDHAERAHEVFDLVERTLSGEIEPKMALFDCRTMGLFPTTMEGPMPAFMAELERSVGKNGILSLSLNHGFPWADVSLAGAKMIAIADGDEMIAKTAAEKFGEAFYSIRNSANLRFTPFPEAIVQARIVGEKPLLIADTADQVGSGAPGDTTHVLRAFVENGIRNAVIAPFWDPLAVEICFKVGEGTKIPLRVGGKYESQSGPPFDGSAEVLQLFPDAYQTHLGDERIAIGNSALILIEGIEILLTSKRTNLYSLSLLNRHGISIKDKQVIAIKNLYKHKDLFTGLVRDQLFVATPGTACPDWPSLTFKKLPRPIWPFDADPLQIKKGQ